MTKELSINLDHLRNYQVADAVPLFPVNPYSENYPGDTERLGKMYSLSYLKEKKKKEDNILNKSKSTLNIRHTC